MIKELPEIPERLEVFGFSTAREIVNQTLHQTVSHRGDAGSESPNISSGFVSLDAITKGFSRGSLTTIGTRPGNGKTAFVLSMIHNISVVMGRRVALFSPERKAVKVISRLIESHTSHSVDRIRKGNLKAGDRAHAMSLVDAIAEASLFIDDTPTLYAADLIQRCRSAVVHQQAEIILIDSPESYVMHILDPERRESALREIIEGTKRFAEEAEVPVVLFKQLPKPASLENGGFIPSLKDLPPFVSALSDNVIFIHRPEYYQAKNTSVPEGSVALITGKLNNKEEKQETFLRFIESIDRFIDPD